MNNRASKIYGLLIFLGLFIGLIYLVIVSLKTKNDEKIEKIIIYNAYHLSDKDYLQFTGLSDSSQYSGLTLADLKQKFESHPYVLKAEVMYDGINGVNVLLHERKLKALLINQNKLNLISEDYMLLPMMDNTAMSKLPVISNPGKIEKETEVFENSNIKQAFRIIDALSISDTNIFNRLAEINLNYGGDVIITFSGIRSPVIFGHGNEAQKITSLKALLYNVTKGVNYIKESTYIDLRYSNKIFIGRNNSEITG